MYVGVGCTFSKSENHSFLTLLKLPPECDLAYEIHFLQPYTTTIKSQTLQSSQKVSQMRMFLPPPPKLNFWERKGGGGDFSPFSISRFGFKLYYAIVYICTIYVESSLPPAPHSFTWNRKQWERGVRTSICRWLQLDGRSVAAGRPIPRFSIKTANKAHYTDLTRSTSKSEPDARWI